jgi:type IV pilus assembly protein PilB
MNDQIIALLASKGLIDQKTVGIVKDLLARGKTLEQALVGARYVTDVDFAKVRAEALGLPYMDLTGWEASQETLDLLPAETIETYHVLPIGVENDTLVVALIDPQDLRASQALEFLVSDRQMKLRIVVVPNNQLRKLLKLTSGVGGDVENALAQAVAKRGGKTEEGTAEVASLQEVIKGAPVARMLTTIMRNAVDQNASDIHIEPIGGESRVRYRVDGVLRTVLSLPLNVHPALLARVKVLSNLKLDETRIPQDGRITQSFGGRKIDFRISTLPVVDNEKVVMRILDTSVGAPTLEQLGYRPEHVAIVKEELKKSHGLLLVTGPTGSGKSTTLFACLNMLNGEGINISTLEDPVEYFIPGINQSQVRPEINYTFAAGLRSLLRQDPNVIMVGEIRDKETVELAIHAALTGHLILSTLHTNDVFGLVPRLIDMGAEPFLLAATLNVGLAQRLARKICPNCKEPEAIDSGVLSGIVKEIAQIPKRYFSAGVDPANPVFYHGKGCNRCTNSGYIGRVAIAEIFMFTATAQRLVQEGFPLAKVQEEGRRQEMISLRQDALLKALDGFTTLAEVLRLSQETQEEEGKQEG